MLRRVISVAMTAGVNFLHMFQWNRHKRKICKPKFNGLCVNGIFFLLIKEFLDDSALVEASSSKDDEILFFLLISNKELKEKAMPYKKHLRQLKCKREEKFSD